MSHAQRSTRSRVLHHAAITALLLACLASHPRVVLADEPQPAPPPVEAGTVSKPPEAEKTTAETGKPGRPASAADPAPIYVPPARSTIGGTVGAGTRGMSPANHPIALAPSHVGLTTRPAPVLYWAVPGRATGQVRVTLAEQKATRALLEIEAARDPKAGIYAIDLAEHGVALELGKTYLWVTTLVPDPERPWKDHESYAAVARVEPEAALQRELAGAPPGQAYRIYARNGIWFDAIQDLSERIVQAPGDAALREARASLLEQVKRNAIARLDRNAP